MGEFIEERGNKEIKDKWENVTMTLPCMDGHKRVLEIHTLNISDKKELQDCWDRWPMV